MKEARRSLKIIQQGTAAVKAHLGVPYKSVGYTTDVPYAPLSKPTKKGKAPSLDHLRHTRSTTRDWRQLIHSDPQLHHFFNADNMDDRRQKQLAVMDQEALGFGWRDAKDTRRTHIPRVSTLAYVQSGEVRSRASLGIV